MKTPNFFIIGAPKCGTTSLASWLGRHPQIFIPSQKEVHFFNTDHSYCYTRSQAIYEQAFRGAGPDHKAVGEASVWYLYSRDAVPNILRFRSDARFIVCLRNPVEMARSLHDQLLVAGDEREPDFCRAWRLQSERSSGCMIPRQCREPLYLNYAEVCKLGSQLDRLYSVVDRRKVLPLLLDDLRACPRSAYRRVLDFLVVPDDGRAAFPVANVAKARRSDTLRDIVRGLGQAKRRLGLRRSLGLLNAVNRLNMRRRQRPPLRPELRNELLEVFEPDIRKLGRLLGRDLDGWLR